ncbi:ketoreductase [Rhizocola hellebori]|uniref:Ketoreductase n=1 Tax=Rhizocola hellebori TaxID=1392758 RepID=A0A8J3VKB2_9ACTN|nr:SDR family oxidoreductase [Rhizocola hellebori]GIH08848.1 ketoreductase [Rhizocola hellebori]
MTVLVTGASGVVGTAVLRELSGYEVVAGVYRRLPTGTDRMVRLDLSAPLLGLDPLAYQQLCAEVEVIVHSAAIVNFSADQAEVDLVNIEGLGRVIELAAEADALLVHISTAYVSRYGKAGGGDRLGTAKPAARTDEYVTSKFLGEQMVRDSGVDAVIVRPSVVIGDSRSGEIRQAQAVHTLAEYLLKGQLPFLPAHPGSYLDLIPQDLVAQGVRAVLDAGLRKGEFWLTAGPAAMPAERFLELVAEEATRLGRVAAKGRLADPGIVDRLVRPAFADVVPKDDLARLDSAVAVCGLVIITDLLPTSLGRLPGGPAALTVADVEQAWRISLRRLIPDLT